MSLRKTVWYRCY